jgi:hypothetical protein
MPKLVFAALCQNYALDRETNVVSLFNLLEEVSLPSEAFSYSERHIVAGEMHLYCLWSWQWPTEESAEPFEAHFRITTPAGYQGTRISATINSEKKTVRARTFIKIEGFVVDRPGMYEFQILRGEEIVGQVPLKVSVLGDEASDMEAVPKKATRAKARPKARPKATAKD